MPLLYLRYTIILISESSGPWKSRLSNHSCQLVGKISPQTSPDHEIQRGASPLAPPRAFVYGCAGKEPAQRPA